ncbi:hypothetical protein [Aporhodopirellula aestuarii]|uniref:Uncharacterized protein n=1 Tax=Aporhodopirellula aestuarii TaxID=2950107 RepID=A0ABT0U305_9BACT|nr:hypothetical protein [Aporhodopirellula aestuarii]MCM2371196.1 hypothetical protein [Aporhodopirellula aestuarii]
MGLFRSSHSDRGGFRRASFGTLFVVGGIAAGVLMGVPMMHQSMTSTHAPVSLSCIELLRDGIPKHTSIIILQDAQVHPPGEMALNLGEQADSPMLGKVQTVLAHPRAAVVVDRLVRGDVLPRGMTRRPGPQPLRLSPGRETADVALKETEETGALVVHVSEDPTAKLICKAASGLSLPIPESMRRAAEIPAFSLHPASLIAAPREAWSWCVGSVLAIVLGLILCGSSQIGWWALFSPVSALIGLPGVILRGGRGGTITWTISLTVGFAGLAAGYHLAFEMGRLGQTGGIWIWQSAGLLAASCGAAAIVGTLLSIRAKRLHHTEDALSAITPAVNSKKSKRSRSKNDPSSDGPTTTSRPAALQSMISANDYTRRYLDPRLNVSANMETNRDVQQQTDSLERLQFDAPLIIELARGEDTIEATVQVGCQNLVMAMTDCLDENLRLRMVSILDDGHVVISGNGEDDRLTQAISGDASSLQVFSTSKAAKLVTKHLEIAAEIAEKRHAKIVTLAPSEWRDLIHYSERCMADTLHHAHLEKWDISEASYGRFAFPPRDVAVLAMA